MKSLTKTLVAATLAVGATTAHAAIDISKSFSSEAFLSVYDKAGKGTFTLDLGVSLGTLVSNVGNSAYSLSYNLSGLSDWNAFKAHAGNDLTQTVYAIAAGGRDGSFNPHIVATSNTQFGSNLDFNALDSASNNLAGHALNINADATALSGVNLNNTAENNSTFVVDGDGRLGHHGLAFNLWNSPVGINPEAAYGDLVDFQLTHEDGSFANNVNTTFAGKWLLSGDQLTYGVSSVPLPAAVWMFGAGLTGLLGLSRRKTSVV